MENNASIYKFQKERLANTDVNKYKFYRIQTRNEIW